MLRNLFLSLLESHLGGLGLQTIRSAPPGARRFILHPHSGLWSNVRKKEKLGTGEPRRSSVKPLYCPDDKAEVQRCSSATHWQGLLDHEPCAGLIQNLVSSLQLGIKVGLVQMCELGTLHLFRTRNWWRQHGKTASPWVPVL